MRQLRCLEISSPLFNGEGLNAVCATLPQLQELDISGCTDIGDADLVCLTSLSGLRRLRLPGQLTDKSMTYLKDLRSLEELSVAHNEGITDRGIAELSVFRNLRSLDVSGTKVTAASLGLFRSLQLERLVVGRDSPEEVDNAFAGVDLSALVSLQSLEICGLSADELRGWRMPPNLRRLALSWVDRTVMRHLPPPLP